MWSEEKGESRDDAVKGEDLRNVGVSACGIAGDIAGETEPSPEPDTGGEIDAGGDDDLVADDEGEE